MKTRYIAPNFFVIFFSFFCYSSMLALFVPLFQDSKSPIFLADLSSNTRAILSGIFLALYPLGQFIGSPIIGALSDTFGRKRILIKSLCISSISLFCMFLSIYFQNIYTLGIFTFIAGLGESNMTIALSSITDLTSTENRGKFFSYAWVMCSVGYIFGSTFGGIVGGISFTSAFLIKSVLLALTGLLVYFYYFETLQIKTTLKIKTIQNTFLTFFEIFKASPIRKIYLSNFLFYIAFFGLLRVQLIYLEDIFDLNTQQIGLFVSYQSIIAMLGNFVIAPRLLKLFSVKQILNLSAFVASLSALIFILPTSQNWLFLTIGLFGISIPVAVAFSCSYLSLNATTALQGKIMGNNQSLQVISEALSAALGGMIFSINPQLPFMVFCFVGFIGLGIVLKNRLTMVLSENTVH